MISLLVTLQNLHGFTALISITFIFIISSLLILPLGLPLNLIAGIIWGTLGGGILINILATLVASISFFIGRWFGHHFLEKFFKKYPLLINFKNTINRYDWQFIAMARLNPIIPFGLTSYIFGIIPELSFRHYILATFLANLIPCFAFASIGSILKTYSLDNTNIHRLILQIGITLLLISILFTLKMLSQRRQYENNIVRSNT